MQNPGSQREKIKPSMPVVDSSNAPFATVDNIEGSSLKLTKDEKGQHHYIPLEWVRTVDDKVHIDRLGAQATTGWSTMPLK